MKVNIVFKQLDGHTITHVVRTQRSLHAAIWKCINANPISLSEIFLEMNYSSWIQVRSLFKFIIHPRVLSASWAFIHTPFKWSRKMQLSYNLPSGIRTTWKLEFVFWFPKKTHLDKHFLLCLSFISQTDPSFESKEREKWSKERTIQQHWENSGLGLVNRFGANKSCNLPIFFLFLVNISRS